MMSSLKTTVFLKKIDWLLPNGAVSVRIAPETTPGSISPGPTHNRNGGRRRKCRTGPPASDPLTVSAVIGSTPLPVAASRSQPGTARGRKTTSGLSGPRRKRKRRKGPYTKNLRKLPFSSNPFDSTYVDDKISCEDVTQSDDEIATILHQAPSVLQPEPCSPALSSTSFLFPSPVPSSFVSSPSPSFLMDSAPSSPSVASPVSPAPEPSSAPAKVHPTPLPHVPVQDTAPSSQQFMSPSVVIAKMERFDSLHNYYISNYNKMTYDARCLAYFWCQQFWNEFMSSVHICKQQRNRNSERHRLDEDEVKLPSDALDQLGDIQGVLEMAVEMGFLSDVNSYILHNIR
ncbi:uncharacterized protein LOC125726371 [Brienomyrus brachyistius]|uniref:uncharacterized protein LOC125726371 n=1 Tax=Brienomyrus brachyistius TaxID=42636 RepID=UPI0020B44B82|nr:uncharacterized protein LOC125726371 [Brienomyrus brachyistius]XP_048858632.1 uncharacterized protein LOC125726371 [Brienomyrus brachyistius]XP_048858633.1 uncharacterized protein LOC125726371 [Brienomyrus brachyistius]